MKSFRLLCCCRRAWKAQQGNLVQISSVGVLQWPEKLGPGTTTVPGHWPGASLETLAARGYQLAAFLMTSSLLKGDLSSVTRWLPQTERKAVSKLYICQQITMSTHGHYQKQNEGTLWNDASKLMSVKSSTCSLSVN